MERKEFLKIAGLTALSIPMMSALNKLENITDSFDSSKRMPVLFLGHGSPMNGIEDNEFVREFKKQGQQLDKPNAIIVVSAHWETNGTFVTAMQNPRTIHDFGGFPKELYEVQYPAPGHPKLAKEISEFINPAGTVHLDDKWGLDHGAWTVVKHLFPKADVPVIQLSLDYKMTPQQHYELAQQLKKLREKGVLIVGSGNIVHNLRKVDFRKINKNYGYDWAIEADSKMKKWILEGNYQNLIEFKKQGEAFNLAIPTPEHYLPLLYTLGLKDEKDNTTIFNDNALGGSLTMTSVKFG
ncbi:MULTISPECIES: 4,5-DOPA dioxygenase extradiol [Flavobacteriaceae]|jgi:4,5-DOPA dioxygenase extradiol|uniref:4,5-DOPA dioxygenase extradiol n=1 Tax=Arenibacter algicola TaxID=616991 RepID=A0A221UWS1_9FLAO|nr:MULTISPECIES: 4,5-DOPA dioxygenase extradiol [Flavobacteriaceae]ASO05700.1 4,5-DOPA dioxygenase extradiol [Arenibacter algicola]MCK0193003.1 4,5-DOPA dioxygenase extradiol [Arenibacter sp. F20364]|tara:strand:- start:133 stop:1020 length:888 start_codon:yes stop_codon:yes gene_type:complete